MADSIKYSIHDIAVNAFVQDDPDALEQFIFTGTDMEVSDAWDALNATDGSGGLIDEALVHSATYYLSGVVDDTYLINPGYDFAYNMSQRIDGSSADPVSGKLTLPS